MHREEPHSAAPTATAVVLHAGLGVFFFLLLMVIVPSYKTTYEEFSVKVPFFAALTMNLSDLVIGNTVPMLVFLALLLALDGAVFYGLYRRPNTRLYSWLWFLLISVASAGFIAVSWLAVWTPFTEVHGLQ